MHEINEIKYLYSKHYDLAMEKCCDKLQDHEMQFSLTDFPKTPIYNTVFGGMAFCPYCGTKLNTITTGRFIREVNICNICGRSNLTGECGWCKIP